MSATATQSSDATASALWNEWHKLCDEAASWHVFSMNRSRRSLEVGRFDWDELDELEAAYEYFRALASVKLTEYKLCRAGVALHFDIDTRE